MFDFISLHIMDDYFTELSKRQQKGVFFYRLTGYSPDMEAFLRKYYAASLEAGIVSDGNIQNPDERQLSYYNERLGMDFRMDIASLEKGLAIWLPRVGSGRRRDLALAIFSQLEAMKKSGKSENILKNAYIKFMCWMYYKFESILDHLGSNDLPKIFVDGPLSNHSLAFLLVLAHAGADVILFRPQDKDEFFRLDASKCLSPAFEIAGNSPFPADFTMKYLRESIRSEDARRRMIGSGPSISACTNAWMKRSTLESVRQDPALRGDDRNHFYNCFCKITGVWNKANYANDLYLLQQEVRNAGRKLVIVNGELPKPSPDEVSQISRRNYQDAEQMILDLAASNLQNVPGSDIEPLMRKAFAEFMFAYLETSRCSGESLPKLTSRAVYLLAWLKRYSSRLFASWKPPSISAFFFFGGCRSENEALFLRFLSRLPVDILVLLPNADGSCLLSDTLLCEEHYPESLALNNYPEDSSQFRMGTTAYHAEQELNGILYQDSGLYRNQQFASANVITLQTMYEEIPILWGQDLKYRPGFSSNGNTLNIPVLFAKISGVKDGQVGKYWTFIRSLITDDTVLIQSAPYIDPAAPNPFRRFPPSFFRNGKIQKKNILNHSSWPYGMLRTEKQEYILDRLQELIELKRIRGMGQNGAEYAALAIVLNLPNDIVRLIQKFDFTEKNPKLLYINTAEKLPSLEDSILAAFLNLIGFDILFFVPTGYQSIEMYFNEPLMQEYQAGEYLYDLQVPNLRSPSLNSMLQNLGEMLFRRGNPTQ